MCFSQIKLIEEAVLNQKLKSQINKIQANSFSNLKAEVKKQDDKKVTELENKIETINLKLANISNHFSSQQNTPMNKALSELFSIIQNDDDNYNESLSKIDEFILSGDDSGVQGMLSNRALYALSNKLYFYFYFLMID